MSKSTIEEKAKGAALLRNIGILMALVVFPALTILLIFFGNVPESKKMITYAIPMLGIIPAGIGAIIMEVTRRKAKRGEFQSTSTEEREERRGVSLIEMIGVLGITSLMIIGTVYLAHDVRKSALAESLLPEAGAFDTTSARSAVAMVEMMHHPVSQAVHVKSRRSSGVKGIVCAVSNTGTLELFATETGRSGSPTLTRVSMNDDLEVAGARFCGDAFAQLEVE